MRPARYYVRVFALALSICAAALLFGGGTASATQFANRGVSSLAALGSATNTLSVVDSPSSAVAASPSDIHWG